MEAITIKDIAKELNLSTSTVSRAIRGSYEISDATKKRVLDYAEKVNYRPNPIALSLRENKTRSIGIIVPEIANNFFSNAINGAEDIAQKRGYHIMIFQSRESSEREKSCLQHVIARKLDGVLLSLSGSTKDYTFFERLLEDKFPMVFFDRVPEGIKANKVIANNFQGAFEGTEHLIKIGRKRIGHITGPSNLSNSQERLAGYKAALKKHNLPHNDNLVRFIEFDYSTITETVKNLIEEENLDALFTAGERLTLSCYEAIKSIDVKIPEEIAMVGFTNINVANLLNPSMTTVSQPAFDLGAEAVNILIDNIEGKKKNMGYKQLELPTFLEIRTSSNA
ncbi:LacI family DNA-binding transcriptional regulator [Arcticibacterium luteifluviistationis]|uniref:LacI family transcriptional regulator n=1 Tax=Arcticibacterium luteifluviistationis TaxID=1784714 RepID=A0A2Z4GGN4_9BACT|nr:LacI family DNA-binding transcriptional regulator [Arcticibacterium luteifluviistationis]AWW00238.1 LacI family transcriptional regulator [Arcticibacterium luteifluviistationis]